MSTIIVARVACWDSELIVNFHDDDHDLLGRRGLLDGVTALFEDTTILVAVDSVMKVHLKPVRDRSGLGRWVGYGSEFQFDAYTGAPRFGLSLMDVEVEDGAMEIALPPIHELHWFSTGNMAVSRARAVYVREFRRRLKSAFDAGAATLEVPTYVRNWISNEVWTRAFSELNVKRGRR